MKAKDETDFKKTSKAEGKVLGPCRVTNKISEVMAVEKDLEDLKRQKGTESRKGCATGRGSTPQSRSTSRKKGNEKKAADL